MVAGVAAPQGGNKGTRASSQRGRSPPGWAADPQTVGGATTGETLYVDCGYHVMGMVAEENLV